MSLNEVYSVLQKNQKASIDLLFEFLKIPCIASENQGEKASINFLERIFGEVGFNCSTFETNGFAVFTAELNTGSDKTLTFYDHYDVQPVNSELWESPPFEPTIRDGKIFARGVADRMYFFDDGLIVETGTPDDIFFNPQEDRTKLFLSQILSH